MMGVGAEAPRWIAARSDRLNQGQSCSGQSVSEVINDAFLLLKLSINNVVGKRYCFALCET